MPSAYDSTVTLGTDGVAQYWDAGAKCEARGDIDGAIGWYELVALNAPYAPEPQFRLGTLLFKGEKVAEAEAAFRRAIALRPGYVDAHLNLGAALHRQGKLPDAVVCYKQALRLDPTQPHLQFNLGVALYQMGDFAQAVERFERSLEQEAGDAAIHYQLGIALHRLGRFDEAVAQCERALALDAAFAPAHMAIGDFLAEHGDAAKAIVRYRLALALNPRLVEAHLALARALAKQRDLGGAARCCEQALALNPRNPAAHYHLGLVLEKAGNQPEAAICHERALNLSPEFALAHCAVGRIERGRGELGKAIARFERAVALSPNLAEAHLGLADTFELQGQYDRAIARFKRAIALAPNRAEAHAALGTALLRQGDFTSGWQEYERRLSLEAATFEPPAGIPRWSGEPLDGERILLCAEQGFGDAIQFVRYAPLVAAMGGRVVLEVRDELRRLVSTVPGIETVGSRDETPDIRWHCPLMSLPLIFGTELGSIPSTIPYLFPDESQSLDWARRLSADGLRVGLSWAGNPAHKHDRERSIDVSAWRRLLDAPGVRFFSLQRDPSGLAGVTPSPDLAIADLTTDLVDFAETAAAIAALDLVITVDTSVAHLAGALGKQVWLLLPYVPDWRWLLGRTDSPWYPTARLFRQASPGAWAAVLDQVRYELNRQAAASERHRLGYTQI